MTVFRGLPKDRKRLTLEGASDLLDDLERELLFSWNLAVKHWKQVCDGAERQLRSAGEPKQVAVDIGFRDFGPHRECKRHHFHVQEADGQQNVESVLRKFWQSSCKEGSSRAEGADTEEGSAAFANLQVLYLATPSHLG